MFKSIYEAHLKPYKFNRTLMNFGIEQVLMSNCVFISLKPLRNKSQFIVEFEWEKYGAPHARLGVSSRSTYLWKIPS